MEKQLSRAVSNRTVWQRLIDRKNAAMPDSLNEPSSSSSQSSDTEHSPRSVHKTKCPAFTFTCIKDALLWLNQGRDSNLGPASASGTDVPAVVARANHIQLFCTGSLHLVGGMLKILDPEMNDDLE